MSGYISYLRTMVGQNEVIMVAAGALIFNQQGHLLLQRRTDTSLWDHPGGFKELRETVQETARREVFEETGLTLQQMTLFDIYSYQTQAPNGDCIDLVKVLFTCCDYTGTLSCQDGESQQLTFFSIDNLPSSLAPGMVSVLSDIHSKTLQRNQM